MCGIDSLWSIFEVVADSTIRERVMYLLVLSYSDQTPTHMPQAMQTLLE